MTQLYARFADIPPFVADAEYSVDVAWTSVEKTLVDMSEQCGMDLDPDFQRGHVWSDEQRSRFVEFVLRGGTSARTILFNQSGWNGGGVDRGEPVVLVDGKQRLEAARMFMRGEIRAFGATIDQFEDRLDRIRHRFTFSVNTLPTRRDVLQWYVDLNEGRVAHSQSEIERVKSLIAAEDGTAPIPLPPQDEIPVTLDAVQDMIRAMLRDAVENERDAIFERFRDIPGAAGFDHVFRREIGAMTHQERAAIRDAVDTEASR